MISQLTLFLLKLNVKEMKIYYFFSSSVICETCCFDDWTDWQPSSLTCGEFCKQERTRAIQDSSNSISDAFGAALSFGEDFFGVKDNCNNIHQYCPYYESECYPVEKIKIDCRESF